MTVKNNFGITIEKNLQKFFYNHLQEVNVKSIHPLPMEAIYYSSNVLDKFSNPLEYFETKDGKLSNKILGTKFLEASSLSSSAQKRAYQDVGDTALFLCGYFSESLNRKIVDTSYYQGIGMLAYKRLDNLTDHMFDIPDFYHNLSKSFLALSMMIGAVAHKFCSQNQQDDFLLFISNKNKIKTS